jgi:HSP20 family molecular chaperone IbpA
MGSLSAAYDSSCFLIIIVIIIQIRITTSATAASMLSDSTLILTGNPRGVNTTDKEVKVVAEITGIDKQNIKVNAYDNSVEITTNDPKRKYHRIVDLPPEAEIETARPNYNNGILEITFNKKKETKPKGKELKVE